MRRVLSLLVLVAALAIVGTAAASPGSSVACGGTCDPGSGYTGCKTISESHSSGAWLVYSIRHVLVVSYCKRNGVITGISIAAHYCDTSGFIGCVAGPAWQTGGGAGYGYASFTGRATWTGTVAGAPYNSTSVVDLTIPYG